MNTIRLTVWNVDRSGVRGQWRNDLQRQRLESVKADVYIITETHENFSLHGKLAAHLSDSGKPPYQSADRAVGIWTSWPMIRSIPTRDGRLTACAEFDGPVRPIFIYGTIIPYRDDGRTEGMKSWESHRRAIDDQLADWHDLKASHPNHQIIIAGDFNMTMGGSNAYVDTVSRTKLLAGCADYGLRCVTDLDSRHVIDRSNIDHVVVSAGLECIEGPEFWWGDTEFQGELRRLSDHNGVTVTLSIP